MTPEQAIDTLENVINELNERVTDFPSYTCSDIDAAIRDIDPVRKTADQLVKDGEPASEAFLVEVDNLLWGLPSTLDDLRHYNEQLRTSLMEALKSRKEAASALETITKELECP